MSPANSENSSVRSTDGGRHWELTAPAVEQYTSLWNTVDPYLSVDRGSGRLFLVHATGPTRTTPVLVDESPLPNGLPTAIAAASGFQVYRSSDDGQTWETADYETAPTGDWEKVFTGPAPSGAPRPQGFDAVVYVCANSPFEVSGPGRLCYRSLDGGVTFAPAGYVFPSPTEPKLCPALAANNGTVGPDGTVYQPVSCSDGAYVAVSTDEGATYAWHPVPGVPGTGNGLTGYGFQVASDTSGVVYATFTQTDRLMLTVSRDHAAHWSRPVDIAARGQHSIQLAQLAAGPAGHVGVAYYAASRAGGTHLTAWATQTHDAAARRPVFTSTALSDPRRPSFVNYGLTGPSPRADYIGVSFGPGGELWVAFVRQTTGPRPDGQIGTLGMVARVV
jgi:hypothetical protein